MEEVEDNDDGIPPVSIRFCLIDIVPSARGVTPLKVPSLSLSALMLVVRRGMSVCVCG